MFKKSNVSSEGSEVQYDPRTAGENLHSKIHPNTELCIDLKLLTRKPGRLRPGEQMCGILMRESEDCFLFLQQGLLRSEREGLAEKK